MSAKHTPGPWRVVDRRPVTGNWASRIPFAIEKVSDTHKAVIPIADVCDQPNAKANARLISAAPELLDGLKATEELLAFHEGSANPATEGGQPVIWVNGEDWQNLLDSTRQLIARAEGGQS